MQGAFFSVLSAIRVPTPPFFGGEIRLGMKEKQGVGAEALDGIRLWQGDTGNRRMAAAAARWMASDYGREIQENTQPNTQTAGWMASDYGREIQDWFHKNLQGVGGMANRAGV